MTDNNVYSLQQYKIEIKNAGNRLCVVNFSSQWCPLCNHIDDFWNRLPERFPMVAFISIDVDCNTDITQEETVTSMPTFIFYLNQRRVERIEGVDLRFLEDKIKYLSGANEDVNDEHFYDNGYLELNSYINMTELECLNQLESHTAMNALIHGPTYLASKYDARLLLRIVFVRPVRIYYIKFKAPWDRGPSFIKIFVNTPHLLDFNTAASSTSIQDVSLSQIDLEGRFICMKFNETHNVNSILLYIVDNQCALNRTTVSFIGFYGSLILRNPCCWNVKQLQQLKN